MDRYTCSAGAAPAQRASVRASHGVVAFRRRLAAVLLAVGGGFAAAQAAPVVSSFTPANGTSGTSVTVNGTGFSATPTNNAVTFNGTAATVSSATTTRLVVTVPTGAATGKIAVTVAGQTGQSAGNFTVKPKITGFTPTTGSAGGTVTISGDGFSTTPASNAVAFFNNKAATVVSASVSQLVVTVPAGVATGTIKVTVGGNTATSASNFTAVQVPVITGFTPTRGSMDTLVTITGSGFSATRANNVVKFNGDAATVTSASSTQLVVRSPDQLMAGPISVTVNGQTGTSTQNFFPPPWLYRIAPAGAAPGASVTLHGINFDPIIVNNQVTFGGVPATITAATFTTLQVTVPAGISSGPVRVSVGPELTEERHFYILPPAAPTNAGLRAYIANPTSSSVTVYDLGADALVAAISFEQPPVWVAASPDGARVYVAHPYGNTVSVLDTATNTVTGMIPLGFDADGVSLSSTGDRLYAWSVKELNAITLATGAVEAIDVGIGNDYGMIYGAGTDRSGTRLYVAYYYSDSELHGHYPVAIHDTATRARLGAFELPGNARFGGMQLDRAGTRMYVYEEGTSNLHIGDAATGAYLGVFAVEGSPAPNIYAVSTDFEPDGSRMYLASYQPGNLTAVDRATHTVVDAEPLPQYIRHLRVSPLGSRFFVASHDGTFKTYRYGPTGMELERTDAIALPRSMTLDAAGMRAVITRDDARLDIVDTVTGAVTTSGVVGDMSARLVLVGTEPADRLAIAQVNGGIPAGDAFTNVPFDVAVRLLGPHDIATIGVPKTVTLSLASGSGTLGGNTQCTIAIGASTCLVSGVVLDTTQPAVVLRASASALTAGNSAPFAVTALAAATITGFTPGAGAVGESVVISGSGFQPSPAVHPVVAFNGVTAEVTAESNTSITAKVPEGATTGPITVTVGGIPASSATPFRVKPAPLVTLTTSPLASRWSDPFTVTVTVSPIAPATETPTGWVNVTDETNHVSCTVVLPDTSCQIPPTNGTPSSVLVSATYMGDDNYGVAQTSWVPHIIAFYDTAIAITGVSKEPTQAGEGTFVSFTLTPVAVPFPADAPIGQVVVSDGTSSCSFYSVFGMSVGGCLLPTPAAGTRLVTARYGGDRHYATTTSAPVAHATSSAGGALPAGTELCGLHPDATYPAATGFVPIAQVPGGVPSAGLAASIVGTTPPWPTLESPQDWSTTNAERIDVYGRFDGPANTGITVGDIVATTSNGRFLASGVPLQPGSNMIAITATTLPGGTATTYLHITRDGEAGPVHLHVDDATPYAPVVQGFEFAIDALPEGRTVQSVSLDLDGDTVWDYQGATLDGAPSSRSFAMPGLHVAKMRVSDSLGAVYDVARAYLVRDPVEQRAMLCDVYGYLRERLAAGDAWGASLAYAPEARGKYTPFFNELGTNMAAASTMLGHVAEGRFAPAFGDLSLVRDNDDQTRSGFPLRMTRGADGVWRISEM